MVDEIENKRNISMFLKIVAVILFIMTIIVLIIARKNNPSFSIGWIILIGLIVLIVAVGLFFGFEIYARFTHIAKQEREGIPEAITMEQIKETINNEFVFNRNYGKYRGKMIDSGFNTYGKDGKEQQVYSEYFEATDGDKFWIGINTNYPKNFKILRNPASYTIEQTKKRLVFHKEEEPDVKERKISNVVTGVEVLEKEKVHKEQKKEEEKKEL